MRSSKRGSFISTLMQSEWIRLMLVGPAKEIEIWDKFEEITKAFAVPE